MKKLTRDERCEISALTKAGKSPSAISKQLERSISTITRELSRNRVDGQYDFVTANEAAIKRRGKHNNLKITLDNWTYVRSLIRQKWSPDQVDRWLKKHRLFRISRGHSNPFIYSVQFISNSVESQSLKEVF